MRTRADLFPDYQSLWDYHEKHGTCPICDHPNEAGGMLCDQHAREVDGSGSPWRAHDHVLNNQNFHQYLIDTYMKDQPIPSLICAECDTDVEGDYLCEKCRS